MFMEALECRTSGISSLLRGLTGIECIPRFVSRNSSHSHNNLQFGYVILTFDNRGSDNRGLKFEGVIKDHMGCYEVQDQVEGIAYVAQNMGFIDVNRVAIEGWSYGGFMSLMAIAQYPDVFKIAISGAPGKV